MKLKWKGKAFFSIAKISPFKCLSQEAADLVELSLEPRLVPNGQEHMRGPLAAV